MLELIKLVMVSFAILIASAFLLAGLFLLMIKPNRKSSERMKAFRGLYIAHRGLHNNTTDAVENSMAAFEKAVANGYGIEMDIQVTKDGVPVVFHDFTLDRACGVKGKVKDYTYDELIKYPLFHSKQRIPKFEDVLKLVDRKVPLIIEYKVERTDLSVCKNTEKLLKDYKGLYCIESFNPLVVYWFRRKHGNIPRGQLSDDFYKELGEYTIIHLAVQYLLVNWLGKPDFIAYNHKYPKLISRRLCRTLFHNTAAAWTIKNEQDLERARANFDIFIFDSFIPKKIANQPYK